MNCDVIICIMHNTNNEQPTPVGANKKLQINEMTIVLLFYSSVP